MDGEDRALGIFLGLAVIFTVSFALLLVFSPPPKPVVADPTVPQTTLTDTGTLDVTLAGPQTDVEAVFDTAFVVAPSQFALSIGNSVEFGNSALSVSNVAITPSGFTAQISFPSFPSTRPLDREVVGNVSSLGGSAIVGDTRYEIFSGTTGDPEVKWSWSTDGFVGNVWATQDLFTSGNPVTSTEAVETNSGNVVVIATTSGATEARTGENGGPYGTIVSGAGLGTLESQVSLSVSANNTISLLSLQANDVRVTQSVDDGVTFSPSPQIISSTGSGDVHMVHTQSGRVALFRDTTVATLVEVVAEVSGVWTAQGTISGLSSVVSLGAASFAGLAAVATVDTGGALQFSRAQSADGGTWSTPVTVAILAGSTFGTVRLLEQSGYWHLYYEYHNRIYMYATNDLSGLSTWSGPFAVGDAAGGFHVARGTANVANVTTIVSRDNGGHLLFNSNPVDLTLSWSATGAIA